MSHPSKISFRTPEQIIEELKELFELGYGAIEEGGHDFCAGGIDVIKWINQIEKYTIDYNIDFKWLIHSTTASLSTPNIIETLQERFFHLS